MLVDLSRAAHVVEVAQADVAPDVPVGTWPCSSCDHDYEVHRGWRVTYVAERDEISMVALVCPGCAELARDLLQGRAR